MMLRVTGAQVASGRFKLGSNLKRAFRLQSSSLTLEGRFSVLRWATRLDLASSTRGPAAASGSDSEFEPGPSRFNMRARSLLVACPGRRGAHDAARQDISARARQ